MSLNQRPHKPLGLPLLALCIIPHVTLAQGQEPTTEPSANKPFRSMAVARDAVDKCRVPKPPKDLAGTAYLRNGYRAILRILIAEEALASETCSCLLEAFTWNQALNALPRFQTSEDPRLPFKVLDLYAAADALEAEVAGACRE